jgi:hypothetical protein
MGRGGIASSFLTSALDGDVCVQLYDPAALPAGRESPVPVGWEAGWALELVCTLRREHFFWP